MHPFRLLGIAAEAEMLRLGQRARRTANWVAFGCIAVLLLLGTLAFGHIAAWYWLRESLPVKYVALVFAGVDFVLAGIFIALAGHSVPARAELEALAVRRQALNDATDALKPWNLLVRLIELVALSRSRK
jgi:hypothetical protein